jgi:hypothetical protein
MPVWMGDYETPHKDVRQTVPLPIGPHQGCRPAMGKPFSSEGSSVAYDRVLSF